MLSWLFKPKKISFKDVYIQWYDMKKSCDHRVDRVMCDINENKKVFCNIFCCPKSLNISEIIK